MKAAAGGRRGRDLGEPALSRARHEEHFLEALARDWPEQLERYEDLCLDRVYLPRTKVDPVGKRVRELALQHGVRDRRAAPLRPPPAPEQLSSM